MGTTLRELIAKVVFRADPAQLDNFSAKVDEAKQRLLGLDAQAKQGVRPQVGTGPLAQFGAALRANSEELRSLAMRSEEVSKALSTNLAEGVQNLLGLRVAVQGVNGELEPAKVKEYADAFKASQGRADEARKAIDRLRLVNPQNPQIPELERQLHELEGEAQQTAKALQGVGVATKSIARPLKEASSETGGLVGLLETLGAVEAAYKTIEFGKEIVNEARAVGDLSARLGITTEEFQTWSAFAEEVGASNEDLAGTVKTLAKNMQEVAQTGKGPAAEAFKKLGISTSGWKKELPNTLEMLLQTGGALGSVENDAKRLALAQEVLGESSLRLLPAFEGGTKAARQQLEELRELAVVYDQDFIKAATAANNEMALFERQMKGIGVQVVLGVLPSLRDFVHWLTPLAKNVRDVVGQSNILNAALIALTRVGIAKLLTQFGGLAGMFKLGKRLLLEFIVPLLVVDDLITFLRGGKSVIGGIIEKLFGVGAAKSVLDELRASWESVEDAAVSLWDTLEVVIDALFDTGKFGSMNAEQLEMAFIKASDGIGEAFDSLWPRVWNGWKQGLADFIMSTPVGLLGKIFDKNTKIGVRDVLAVTPLGLANSAVSAVGGFGKGFAHNSTSFGAQGEKPEQMKQNADAAMALGGAPAVGQSKSTTVTVNDNSTVSTTLNGVDGKNVQAALRTSERNVTGALKRSRAQVVRQTVGAAGT